MTARFVCAEYHFVCEYGAATHHVVKVLQDGGTRYDVYDASGLVVLGCFACEHGEPRTLVLPASSATHPFGAIDARAPLPPDDTDAVWLLGFARAWCAAQRTTTRGEELRAAGSPPSDPRQLALIGDSG